MFKIFKSKELTDDELFSALKKDGIAVTEQDIRKAKENDAETLYKIGEAYYEKRSHKKAFRWYYKAALLNHADSQVQVGGMYILGRGVSKDYKQAMDWSMKAASTGNATAQCSIGELYYFGRGVSQDYKQAMDWYLEAANNGNTDAMNQIGWMYQNGYGVTKNIHTAIEWYTKAANQGDIYTQFWLGRIYIRVREVFDQQKAVNWYQKAADNGYEDAKLYAKLLNDGGYYAQEDQKDKGMDQVVDMNSIQTRTTENINQKMKEDLDSSKDRTQSMIDLTEEKYKMRIEALQKESDLHEQEKQQQSEENKQLRDEVAKLKALLQDNAINDIYYDSDDEGNNKKEHATSDESRIEHNSRYSDSDSGGNNKKDIDHTTDDRIEHNNENDIHQTKVILNSASNSVDLNYDSDENCADPNYDSDDNCADPNYDSSDNEDLTKDLCLD